MRAISMRVTGVAMLLWMAAPAGAQQRPLITEDPQTIGAGRLLFELGFDYEEDVKYPLSGLSGNELNVPNIGLSVGLGSFGELQIDGGLYQRLTITEQVPGPIPPVESNGSQTTAVQDIQIGAKLRLVPETSARPAIGFRFSTRLPNADNESGLGRDVTDFGAGFLVGKTMASTRVVGNIGFLILQDATSPARQDDLLAYGLSIAQALGGGFELVTEANGRANLANVETIDAEDRGFVRVGARFTRHSVRLDGGVKLGLSPRDPDWGVTGGLTWVVDAFRMP